MVSSFTVNGYTWRVKMVPPESDALIDRTNTLRLATTDPDTMTIYLSSILKGSMLTRVLIHEIGHCIIWSYGLFDEIHRMVKPWYWQEAEEWICNFVADYGMTIFDRASKILGTKALYCVPEAMEKLIA